VSKFTPNTETVLDCFLDGAGGEFIAADFNDWLNGMLASEHDLYINLIFEILREYYAQSDKVMDLINSEGHGVDNTMRIAQTQGSALERIWELIEDADLGLIDAYDKRRDNESGIV